MAGWYIRRGESVIGPATPEKLKELVAQGRLLGSDLLAKDPAGPWTEAGKTPLFSQASSTTSLAPKVVSSPAKSDDPNLSVQAAPPAQESKPLVIGKAVALSVARGTTVVGASLARAIGTWSQRRHELKLAKIAARKPLSPRPREAQSGGLQPWEQQPPQAPVQIFQQAAPAQPYYPPPPPPTQNVAQTTIIKIINRNGGGGCSCSGCLGAILLAILAVWLVAKLADPQHVPTGGGSPSQTQQPGHQPSPSSARPADARTEEGTPPSQHAVETSAEDLTHRESAASSLLKSAQTLEGMSKHEGYLITLRKIVKNYAGTTAAATAQKLLDAEPPEAN